MMKLVRTFAVLAGIASTLYAVGLALATRIDLGPLSILWVYVTEMTHLNRFPFWSVVVTTGITGIGLIWIGLYHRSPDEEILIDDLVYPTIDDEHDSEDALADLAIVDDGQVLDEEDNNEEDEQAAG